MFLTWDNGANLISSFFLHIYINKIEMSAVFNVHYIGHPFLGVGFLETTMNLFYTFQNSFGLSTATITKKLDYYRWFMSYFGHMDWQKLIIISYCCHGQQLLIYSDGDGYVNKEWQRIMILNCVSFITDTDKVMLVTNKKK